MWLCELKKGLELLALAHFFKKEFDSLFSVFLHVKFVHQNFKQIWILELCNKFDQMTKSDFLFGFYQIQKCYKLI